MIKNFNISKYCFIVILLLFYLLNSCKSQYDIYLNNSCIECKDRLTKLYTINSMDTFFYSPKYSGHYYHDGLLVMERKGVVMSVKEISSGKKNGIYKLFFESGVIKVEGNFINNVKSGSFIYYSDSNIVCIDSIEYFRNGYMYKKIVSNNGKCNSFR